MTKARRNLWITIGVIAAIIVAGGLIVAFTDLIPTALLPGQQYDTGHVNLYDGYVGNSEFLGGTDSSGCDNPDNPLYQESGAEGSSGCEGGTFSTFAGPPVSFGDAYGRNGVRQLGGTGSADGLSGARGLPIIISGDALDISAGEFSVEILASYTSTEPTGPVGGPGETGTISGQVCEDLDSDTVPGCEEGDNLAGGVDVTLGPPGGTPTQTVTTDAAGFYQFTNVPFGDYHVTAVNPPDGSLLLEDGFQNPAYVILSSSSSDQEFDFPYIVPTSGAWNCDVNKAPLIGGINWSVSNNPTNDYGTLTMDITSYDDIDRFSLDVDIWYDCQNAGNDPWGNCGYPTRSDFALLDGQLSPDDPVYPGGYIFPLLDLHSYFNSGTYYPVVMVSDICDPSYGTHDIEEIGPVEINLGQANAGSQASGSSTLQANASNSSLLGINKAQAQVQPAGTAQPITLRSVPDPSNPANFTDEVVIRDEALGECALEQADGEWTLLDTDCSSGGGADLKLSFNQGDSLVIIGAQDNLLLGGVRIYGEGGVVPPTGTGSIGDLVWNDDNRNGVQDAGEQGREGVTVNLTDQSTGQVQSATTGLAGGYLFNNLPLDRTYTVDVDVPVGYSLTTANSPMDIFLTGSVYSHNPDNPSVPDSFVQVGGGYQLELLPDGFAPTVGYSYESLNDGTDAVVIWRNREVWALNPDEGLSSQFCRTNPDNGELQCQFHQVGGGFQLEDLMASGETPVVGYAHDLKGDGTDAIVLWTDADVPWVLNRDAAIGTGGCIADPNSPDGKNCKFIRAGGGSMVADFLAEGGSPTVGYSHDIQGDGYDDIILWRGSTAWAYPDHDDIDNDGIVEEFHILNPNGESVASLPQGFTPTVGFEADTDGDGAESVYLFSGSEAWVADGGGTNQFRSATSADLDGLPAGYAPVVGYKFDLRDSGDTTDGRALWASADYLDADFGIASEAAPLTGSIGDTVWNDEDANGIQDPGEAGIPNATVILVHDGVADFEQTDANGNYLFEGLTIGDTYQIDSVVPQGYPELTTNNDPLTITLNGDFLDADFGYRRPAEPLNGTITGIVWHDDNQNTVIDSGEQGIPNATVIITKDGVGNFLTTDANGVYSSTSLEFGTYEIESDMPAGYTIFTTNNSPTTINLTAQDPVANVNFGYDTEDGGEVAPELQIDKTCLPPLVAAGGTINYEVDFRATAIVIPGQTYPDALNLNLNDVLPHDSQGNPQATYDAGSMQLSYIDDQGVPQSISLNDGPNDDAGEFEGYYNAATEELTITTPALRTGPPLPNNVVLNFSATVTAAAGTTITNTAIISADNAVAEVTAVCSAQVRPPTEIAVLSVTKTAPTTAEPGETFTYNVSVTNTSPVPANDVVMQDFYDKRYLTVNSVSGNGQILGTNDPIFGLVEWTYPVLAPGETRTETVTVTVDDPMPEGTTVLEDTIFADGDNALPDSLTVETRVTVTGPVTGPVLSSTKSVSDINGGNAEPGDLIEYVINVYNQGDQTATGVTVTDDLPAEIESGSLQVVSIPSGATDNSTSTGGANGTGRVEVTNITVGSGQTVQVAYRVRIDSDVANGTAIENIGVVTYDGQTDRPSGRIIVGRRVGPSRAQVLGRAIGPTVPTEAPVTGVQPWIILLLIIAAAVPLTALVILRSREGSAR